MKRLLCSFSPGEVISRTKGHLKYFRVDNEGRDWPAKSTEAREILSGLF